MADLTAWEVGGGKVRGLEDLKLRIENEKLGSGMLPAVDKCYDDIQTHEASCSS
jgi:hypothetical protein